jgi:hypothetical protein
MQPDPSYLRKKIVLEQPLIGLYDAPDAEPFEPIVRPHPLGHACIFSFYKKWQKDYTLQLTSKNYGCGGASHHLFDQPTQSREDFEHFLCDTEGLKADIEIMREWINHIRPYKPNHDTLFIGPLKPDQYEYLRTVSFLVNPDQLSMLMIGAQYYSTVADPEPVIAPFGSGCMLMVSLFESLDVPQAIIGGTDMAMRQYLPPNLMSFTVTKPMFENLCRLDSRSFLEKSFISRLKASRKKMAQ